MGEAAAEAVWAEEAGDLSDSDEVGFEESVARLWGACDGVAYKVGDKVYAPTAPTPGSSANGGAGERGGRRRADGHGFAQVQVEVLGRWLPAPGEAYEVPRPTSDMAVQEEEEEEVWSRLTHGALPHRAPSTAELVHRVWHRCGACAGC